MSAYIVTHLKNGNRLMFNSLINPHDFVVLYEKIRRTGFGEILFKLVEKDEERVRRSWSHTSGSTSNWWDIPEVQRRWNYLITGSADKDHVEYISEKYLNGDRPLAGISLGCGSGNREIRWVSVCKNLRLTGIDVSKERIEQARINAQNAGVGSKTSFEVADVHALDPGEKRYDVVIVEGALHHFHAIGNVLDKIRVSLRDNGIFIVNEYVGPARFQWTDKQLETANRVLGTIPHEYRRKYFDGTLKKKIYRPGRLSMYLNDPSESAESNLIENSIAGRFSVLEKKEYGGTLLQLIFKDIAHNFTDGSNRTKKLLDSIFAVEDDGLKRGELKSDFVLMVCRNK